MFPYLKSCKSDYLNVCQKQKRKNPYAEIYRFLKDLSYSRKAVSCIWNIPLVLPCRMETNYLGAMMWMLNLKVWTLLQISRYISSWAVHEADIAKSAIDGSPSACMGILRSSPIWVSAFLLSAEHISCSTVPALKRFLTMEFCFEFLDVRGSLERMKRNFDLCDFNRCFQLYFLSIFWKETQFIENTSAMRGEPFQDLPGMLKVPYWRLGGEGMIIHTSPYAL